MEEKDLGTVLVIGNSGVGKSTLINAVLGEERAETGWGRKGTTKRLNIYHNEELSFRLVDTVGFEPSLTKELQAINSVKKWSRSSAKDGEEEKQINCIWFCVDGTSRKLFDKTIRDLSRATKMWRTVPVIAVITKPYSQPERAENIEMVTDAFAAQRKFRNLKKVLPVVAETYTLNDTAFAPPEGIIELIDLTNELLPEGKKAAKYDIDSYNLSRKRAFAHGLIGVTTTSAIVIGAVPIPVPDASILEPVEVGLVNGLAKIYGIPNNAEANTFINSIIEVGTVGVAAKTALAAIKAIPGVNIAASALNGVVSGVLVAAIGESSKYLFEKVYLGEKSLDDIDWAKKIVEGRIANESIETVKAILKSLDGKVDRDSIIKVTKTFLRTRK